MTREEAIERLKQNKAAAEFYAGMVQNTNAIENELKDIEAMNMAIEALSAEAVDVYKAHEEEHLKIINRIKELQYEIAKTQTIVGKMVESAEAEDRHYIKIYADDEPSVKAEKLYQICGETQKREVTEWLKEYFPSAEPKTGEWILECDSEGEGDNLYRCSKCGCKYGCQEYDKPNFCPNCGTKMGGDTE